MQICTAQYVQDSGAPNSTKRHDDFRASNSTNIDYVRVRNLSIYLLLLLMLLLKAEDLVYISESVSRSRKRAGVD
jgi:hypothetical protein